MTEPAAAPTVSGAVPWSVRWLPGYLWAMALLSLVITLLPEGVVTHVLVEVTSWVNPYPSIDLASTLSLAMMASAPGRRKRITMILMSLASALLLLL